jgi:hypothetical protein
MEYDRNDWLKRAEKYLSLFEREVMGPARGVGFKFKKGEVKFPEELVKELIRESYLEGVRDALSVLGELK